MEIAVDGGRELERDGDSYRGRERESGIEEGGMESYSTKRKGEVAERGRGLQWAGGGEL